MNIKDIKLLAQLMEKSGLTLLEITEEETTIKMERKIEGVQQISMQPTIIPSTVVPIIEDETKPTQQSYREIKSPMVGVFYTSSAPDAEPYVTVGSEFKKDDILCIIEAMKVMNEIPAECDGKIVEVCVENGEFVEYDQCLFKVE